MGPRSKWILNEDKSIKSEKNELKKILREIKNGNSSPDLEIRKKSIEKSLYSSGVDKILFDGDWYYLNRSEMGMIPYKNKETKPDPKYSKKLPPLDDILNNDKSIRMKPIYTKGYDVYDIVNINTDNANIKSVYMGMEGVDAQDILDKINPEFEKSDPFDGVFVLFTENLPKIFLKKGIRIFLLNENDIGKSSQIIKAYDNNGNLISKYKVKINSIKLVKKQEMPYKIAASLKVEIGPMLEKINNTDLQYYLNERNEVVNFKNYNLGIDFEEIL